MVTINRLALEWKCANRKRLSIINKWNSDWLIKTVTKTTTNCVKCLHSQLAKHNGTLRPEIMSRNKVIQRNSINPFESLLNILPCDRPILSIQLVENYDNCPSHFVPLHKTLDDTDADLFKENILFGKKNTRYLCISKTEGVPNFVLEKLRIINNGENLANEGFISIKSTTDTNQKAWRKKQLVYKLSKTEAVTDVITDIIILTKFNRLAPEGFLYLGELERVHICYKVAPMKPEIVDFTHQIENLRINSNVYPSVSIGNKLIRYNW